MRFAFAAWAAAWVLPSASYDAPASPTVSLGPSSQTTTTTILTTAAALWPPSALVAAPSAWISTATSTSTTTTTQTAAAVLPSPPSKADIQLLRQAFAEFYGLDRDLRQSEQLLSQVIDIWTTSQQPDDEVAGLYRVRGDCYTALGQADAAIADYSAAIRLLRKSPASAAGDADPEELPAALLGRARALKSVWKNSFNNQEKSQQLQAAADYQLALKLSSREDWDTDEELVEDGAIRNPFAAWEWGTVLRRAGALEQAAVAHELAAEAFSTIGDKPRSVIALVDAGIDLASVGTENAAIEKAKKLLGTAIAQAKGVEGRDVDLLQRVVAKEGEGRMALAALLWTQGQRSQAEADFGQACARIDQLQAFAAKRNAATTEKPLVETRLMYSIDDEKTAADLSCTKFKNPVFLTERLEWPESLQKKFIKLEKLQP